MDALKKLPLPWIAIALLVLVVIVMMFRQRRSGYTPPTGNVITMMDLQEFSAFSPERKANYVIKLADYQPRLSNALSSNSMVNYKKLLDEVMMKSMVPQMPKCPPGQYSPTGSQPGCIQCPENTYCPLPGTITPTQCPQGTTSLAGSVMAASCVPMPGTKPEPITTMPVKPM